MNESADATVSSTTGTPHHARARLLGAASLILGVFPAIFAGAHALMPIPMPSAFPWPWFLLAVAGAILAIGALRARPRGALAVWLAITGLVLSLVLPALIGFVFVYYFNWS
jgi:hypothetical protein